MQTSFVNDLLKNEGYHLSVNTSKIAISRPFQRFRFILVTTLILAHLALTEIQYLNTIYWSASIFLIVVAYTFWVRISQKIVIDLVDNKFIVRNPFQPDLVLPIQDLEQIERLVKKLRMSSCPEEHTPNQLRIDLIDEKGVSSLTNKGDSGNTVSELVTYLRKIVDGQ